MDITGRVFNNRYAITGALNGPYYRAKDLIENRPVVLHVLENSAVSPRVEDRVRFRTENIAVSSLIHENILTIYEISEDAEYQFVAMKDFQGGFLSELTGEALPLEKSLSIVRDLSLGLEALHINGIIHKSVRPDTVVMTEKGAKFTGIGLAHICGMGTLSGRDELNEIFTYLSPEQCGILKRNVDERSDLYSIGVILYRLITGTTPFAGGDLNSIAYQQAAVVPSNPGDLREGVPPVVDEIVMKLLKKEPDFRYQSASGLATDLERILSGSDSFIIGLNDRNVRLSFKTRFIGREAELKKLTVRHDEAREGKGLVCFIRGDRGTGKTRLLEEFASRVYQEGGTAITAECSMEDSKIPYSPVYSLLESYISLYDNYSEERQEEIARELKAEFGPAGRIILALNPNCGAILGECPPLEPLDPEKENQRFRETVKRFFYRIAEIENGLAILLDDIHYSDKSTLTLLAEIINGIEESYIIAAGAYRQVQSEEATLLDGFLNDLRGGDHPVEDVRLFAFDLKRLNQLMATLLFDTEEKTRAIAEYVFSKSSGNPFISLEIVKHLIENGIVYYDGITWAFDEDRLDEETVPPSILDIVIGRIKRLETTEQQVLTRASVIGRDFELGILYRVCNMEPEEVVKVIDRSVSLQLVETDLYDRVRARFYHEDIRKAFYEGMDSSARREIHLQVARRLEMENRDRGDSWIYDIAHHYIEGGDREKAMQYAFPAGIRAKENFANEDAVRYLGRVIQLLEEGGKRGNRLWVDAVAELGEIYVRTGDYHRVIDTSNDVLPHVKDTMQLGALYRQIAEAYYRLGHWKQCEESTRAGMALLGERLPVNRLVVNAGLVKELLVHFIHWSIRPLFIRKGTGPKRERYSLIVKMYISLAMSYALNSPLKLIRTNYRVLRLARRRIGPSRELGSGLYAIGGMLMTIPLFERAQHYFETAAKYIKEDEWEMGQLQEITGYYREWRGDYDLAMEHFEKGYEIFDRIGDTKEFSMILNGLEHCYYYKSDYTNARLINDQYYELANRVNDEYCISAADIYYSQLFRETGDPERADSYAWKSNRLSIEKEIWFNVCSSLNELGTNALERGDYGAAVGFLEEARMLYEKNIFLKQYVILLYTNLASAYIHLYNAQGAGLDPGERKRALKRMKRAGLKALRRTRKWPTHHCSALRVMGDCYAALGNRDRAEEYYLRAITLSEGIGRRYELALARFRYGDFLLRQGDVRGGRENLETAYGIFSSINAQAYVDRVSALLGIDRQPEQLSPLQRMVAGEKQELINELSRRIGLLSSVDELLGELITRLMELTGAREGAVFIRNDNSGELEMKVSRSMSGEGIREVPETMVRNVYAHGGSAVLSGAGKNNGPRERGQAGSMVLVPVQSRGNVIGVFYLGSALVSELFTEEDSRFLTEFLSRVGVTLENAYLQERLELIQKEEKTPERQALTPSTEEKIVKALRYLELNYRSDISREGLAASLDINPDHLGKSFKAYTGKTMNGYINELRIKDAAQQLVDTDSRIIDIAFSVGFESLSTFNRSFLKEKNMSPKKYRESAISIL